MGYRDPEFEVLPAGWSISELQELVENHNPKRQPLNSQERVTRQGVYPYCGANGVVDHINDFKFDGDFVLIAEDGGYWGKHQPSSYIMRGRFWVNNHAHVVRAKDGVTTNEYLSFMLNYLNIDPFIGGDARGKLTKAVLQQIEVPHPDFPEQQRIAQVLSTVQEAIAQQERLIRTTTELKQALMQKLFTEGLRGEALRETEIGMVPESWEVVKVMDAGTVVTGSTPSTSREDFYGGNYNLISPGDLDVTKYVNTVQKKLTALGFDQCRKLPKGAVLVGCIGNVGKVGIVADDRSATNQQINAIIPNERYDGEFLYYAMDYNRKRLEALAGKVTIPLVNKSNFERFQIAAPPINDQKLIAEALDAVDARKAVAEKKRNALQDLFRTLLHELMTGKVRVGDKALANA